MNLRLPHSLEQAKLCDLISSIEAGHHTFTRNELGRIKNLFQQHSAASIPRFDELLSCFNALSNDLVPHLMKEENILFPHIVAMERDPENPPPSCFGTVANPIYMMQIEHASCLKLLRQLRELAGNYDSSSNDAAAELYSALAGLDDDLVQHIHWEDEILFPRALRLETVNC